MGFGTLMHTAPQSYGLTHGTQGSMFERPLARAPRPVTSLQRSAGNCSPRARTPFRRTATRPQEAECRVPRPRHPPHLVSSRGHKKGERSAMKDSHREATST